MSFSPHKSWDNRDKKKVVIDPKTGRSWTRRIRWLTGESFSKIKMEDGEQYREVLTDDLGAQRIWDRFKAGQPIDDCVSILGSEVPKALKSKKAGES